MQITRVKNKKINMKKTKSKNQHIKTLIVMVSFHHKNTEKIAKAIKPILNAKIIHPSQIDKENLNKYDLIGFGSGVYFYNLHRSLIKVAIELNLKLKRKKPKVFIFSTAGMAFKIFHSKLRKILKNKGFDVIGEFSCLGFDSYGIFKLFNGGFHKNHPDSKDIENAKKFAREIKSKLFV
jgi:flavodoxin